MVWSDSKVGHHLVSLTIWFSFLEAPLRWFHKVQWILFTVATTTSLLVATLFWSILAPLRTVAKNTQPITIHLHAVITLFLVIEIFMVAFPVRFLHCIYCVLFAIVYAFFTLILHLTGVNSAIYSAIDYKNNFSGTVIFICVIVFIAEVVLNGLVYLLYYLRKIIAKKLKKDEVIHSHKNSRRKTPKKSMTSLHDMELGYSSEEHLVKKATQPDLEK